MCFLCGQFGDPKVNNGVWYLNPKNYAKNMYKLREPGEGFKGADAGLETGARTGGPPVSELLLRAAENSNFEEVANLMKRVKDRESAAGAQVVALEDADKVLEMCSPIGLIGCICRKGVRAIDERNEHEYTCMGMGEGMLKWERWPERYKGGIKLVNIEEAKEWNHEMDKRGFVHILMLFGAPYIGGFCQCDYPDCGVIRNAVDFGLGPIRGHNIAMIDYTKCNGCGICAQRCQWGALKFEVTTDKANIDMFKCYGCGLCQTGCPRGAINLVDRRTIPAVAEVWR